MKKQAVLWGGAGMGLGALILLILNVLGSLSGIVDACYTVFDHVAPKPKSDEPRPDRHSGPSDTGAALVMKLLADGGNPFSGEPGPPGFRARPEPPLPAGMVLVPGGRFPMGSTEEELEQATQQCLEHDEPDACAPHVFRRELPQKVRDVSAFWMDPYEVTNEKFAAWINAHAAEFSWAHERRSGPGAIVRNAEPKRYWVAVDWPNAPEHPGLARVEGEPGVKVAAVPGSERKPVTFVAWAAADEYCRANGLALPSSEQWEYAARGPAEPGRKPRVYPWGDEAPACSRVPFTGCENAGLATIGEFQGDTSWCKLYDLAGNVSEWTSTQFHSPPRSDGAGSDPMGCGKAPETRCREIRGGAWNLPGGVMRAASVSRFREDSRLSNVGFRCVSSASARPGEQAAEGRMR